MTLCCVFYALLYAITLECLITNLLVIIALYRLWSIFEDTDCPGFASNIEVSVGQKPLYISAFG
jgi:hypothetical protein